MGLIYIKIVDGKTFLKIELTRLIVIDDRSDIVDGSAVYS